MADLHPEATELLDELGRRNLPPSAALSPAGARAALREVLIERGPEIEVGRVRQFPIEKPGDSGDPSGDLALRCYEPDEDGRGNWADGSIPILVYYHGGGWVRGDLDTHDELCRYFTSELGCLTVAVEYRRAPEHSFPAAAEDAYAALRWVGEHTPVFGADSRTIAVAGDSAGGNLATVAALAARDRGGPDLRHQVLLYPATDHAFDTDSYDAHAENPMLSRATMKWYWEHYLSRAFDGAHPYASPLRARDLDGLPSATVITAATIRSGTREKPTPIGWQGPASRPLMPTMGGCSTRSSPSRRSNARTRRASRSWALSGRPSGTVGDRTPAAIARPLVIVGTGDHPHRNPVLDTVP